MLMLPLKGHTHHTPATVIAQRSPRDHSAILGHTHTVAGAIIGRRRPIIAPIMALIFPQSSSGYGPLFSHLAIL